MPDCSNRGCLCGRGGIFKVGVLCPVHDDPEIEVIAKALAEWSSEMPWERRHPKHREHWLRMARKGYEAIANEHAVIVAEKEARHA